MSFFRGKYTLTKIGDRRYLWLFTKAIYHCRLCTEFPLTFHDGEGRRIRPAMDFKTDMGSIPLSVQMLYPKDRFLLSYLLHDSGYSEHLLYLSTDDPAVYVPTPYTRLEVDQLLRRMIRAEGGKAHQAAAIYAAVRAGGWPTWGKRHAPT